MTIEDPIALLAKMPRVTLSSDHQVLIDFVDGPKGLWNLIKDDVSPLVVGMVASEHAIEALRCSVIDILMRYYVSGALAYVPWHPDGPWLWDDMMILDLAVKREKQA